MIEQIPVDVILNGYHTVEGPVSQDILMRALHVYSEQIIRNKFTKKTVVQLTNILNAAYSKTELTDDVKNICDEIIKKFAVQGFINRLDEREQDQKVK